MPVPYSSVLGRLVAAGCLLALGLAAPAAHARDDLYQAWRWSHFGAAEGLPHETVPQLAESVDGTLWAGTLAGLAWYDGYLWIPCGVSHGVPEQAPAGIVALADGRVAAVFGGRLYLGDTSGFEAMALAVFVSSVGPLPTGGLAILSRDSQLLKWQGGAVTPLRGPEGIPAGDYVALRAPRDGDLHLQTTDALLRLTDDGWRAEQTGLSLYNLAVADDGGHYASNQLPVTKRGLWHWTAGDAPRRLLGGVVDMVRTIVTGPHGRLLVVYESGVVLYGEGADLVTLDPVPQPLTGVLDARYRHNGDLVLATAHGVYIYRTLDIPWSRWQTPGASLRNRVDELLVATDGSVWIGTDAGVEVRRPDGSVGWFDEAAGRRVDIVTAMAEDAEGGIWVGSGAQWDGALRYHRASWSFYDSTRGLAASKIHRIHRDRDGRVWFLGLTGTHGSHRALRASVVSYHEGRFTPFALPDSLGDGRVHSFAQARDGALWFSGVLGIGRWHEGRWTRWTTDNGLHGNSVFVLAAGPDGTLYFADRQNGLGLIDADGVRYLDSGDGLINDQVWDLDVDARGVLWLATRGGLSAYDDGDWSSYGTASGLEALELWPVVADDGRLLVGSAGKGTFVLDRSRAERPPPRVVIGEPLMSDEEAVLRWSAFSYEGVVPSAEIRTRYALDDGDWSAWSTQREAAFGGLSGGRHHLRVQARGQFGQLSNSATALPFDVRPAYYRRPLFFIPVGLSTLAVLLLSIALVVRRQRHTAALTESENRYRSFFEEAPISLWEHDYAEVKSFVEGLGCPDPEALRRHLTESRSDLFECMKRIRVLAVNRASLELFEATDPEQLLGQMHRVFRRDSYPTFLEGIVTIARGEARFSHEARAYTLGGQPLNVVLSWAVAPGQARDFQRVLVSVLDITAQQQAADEMRQAAAVAEEANLAKSAFLASTSHEIRTPINAIMGMAQALQEEDLPAHVADDIDVVLSASESLSKIVNDLLDLSKIEAGQLELEIVPFEPLDVIEEVRRTLAPRATQRDLTLLVTVPKTPMSVLGDPTRLRQILLNLMANALKFTEHGGVELSLQTRTIGDHVRLDFAVQDSGIGIAAEKLEAIFEPFTQADSTITRAYGGTGLGLSICKRLVELMDGEIHAESQPGRGSSFRFHLRLPTHEGVPATTVTVAVPDAALRPLRILLAEDNDLNRKVAHALLRREQHDIVEAVNGRLAVETYAEAGPFDVVLMDVQMPEMDGLAATGEIRRLEAAQGRPRTPIIALTANAMKGHREQCLSAGMDDFISKPVRKEALLRSLAVVCGGAVAVTSVAAAEYEPIVDPSVLDELRELEGIGDFSVAEMIDLYLQDTPERVQALRQALTAGDAVVAHREAHTIKGSCREVGARAAAGVALQIETSAKQGELAAAGDLLATLDIALEAARARLTEIAAGA